MDRYAPSWQVCGANIGADSWPSRNLQKTSYTISLPPLGTVILLTAVLLPFVAMMIGKNGPFFFVVSGRLFASSFDRIHVGTVMDQPTAGKWFILFTFFSALILPYVSVVRWLSNRNTRIGYWAFADPTIALCFFLLVMLTLPFFWTIQYIDAMGITPKRFLGLSYGLLGYATILGFLCWAIWPPKGRDGY